MKLLVKLFLFFFTPYAHPFEWRANRFFTWINSLRSREQIIKKLTPLLQENTLVFNVWLEKKFKNYKYLSRHARRKMYKNSLKIEADFDRFCAQTTIDKAQVYSRLARFGVKPSRNTEEQFLFLAYLCAYFDPAGRYLYRQSSSFGKLLVDPSKERMVGDCNQIVTLYTHFFARKFPVDQLSIKLLPGHVCLHYCGLDIEATNGTFQKYTEYVHLAPLVELAAVNLLDVSDPEEGIATIAPETFVKGAQLALALSHSREVVENNIAVAYRNLCVTAMKAKNFERAHFFADMLKDARLKKTVYSAQFNETLKGLVGVHTMADAKAKKETYRKLLSLARLMGDGANERKLSEMLKHMDKP